MQWSLYATSPSAALRYAQVRIYLRVLIIVSTRTYLSICVYLRKCLPRTYFGEYVVLTIVLIYREGIVFMQVKEPCKGDTPA